MYARGMSQRDIAKTIKGIYGFQISHDMISNITDTVLPELETWQSRPLSKCYGAPSLKACQSQLETFQQQWSQYPGAIDVWVRNFKHVEQLFDYGSAIRKIMYTTNGVERVSTPFFEKSQRKTPSHRKTPYSKSFIYT